MTKDELIKKNPWNKGVAKLLSQNDDKCLFRNDNKWYVCENDRDVVGQFNIQCAIAKQFDYQIITNTPPEPWRGNPFEANLIILSLNPGYDPNINMSLANLLQSNEMVRKELVEFRAKTLRLEAESFMPKKEDKEPISCFEAEDMLSGWYWTTKFKELRRASEIEEYEFYKRVAVIEFHGYSSKRYHEWFGNQPKYLKSQKFNRSLIRYIVENRREEVCFLVLRSWRLWKGLLGENFIAKNKELFQINDHNPRCQYLTENNLTPNVWERIITAIKR